MGALRTPEWVRDLLDLALPPACLGCGARIPPGRPDVRVCGLCRSRLRGLPWPRCGRCHMPVGTGRTSASAPCQECADWPPILRGARSAVPLEPPADRLVHALKYEGWRELSHLMARRMSRLRLPDGVPWRRAVLVPVPTTRSRRRSRGYNQAEALARALSRRTGRPWVRALRRRPGGRTQVALHPDQRRANVSTAFSARPEAGDRIRGRPVLLVDDVLTTGATATAGARVLEGTGVEAVVVLTFARALPYRSGTRDRVR